jgi:mono/diheme cytochrome c family protein
MARHRRLTLASLALAAALAAACGGEAEKPAPGGESSAAAPAPAAPPPASAPAAGAAGTSGAGAAAQEARQIFETRCATCHGPNGEGNGPASAGLVPPPRNLRDPAWQQAVSDAHIESIIQYGGAAVGKSPTMPANPDLTSKPDLVAALRAHVRGLAAK